MINLPDKIHSTAIDNKAVDSIQAEYIDSKGREKLKGIDNVKDTLDIILDQLFPSIPWSIVSIDYTPIITETNQANESGKSYYVGTPVAGGYLTVGTLNVTFAPGNSEEWQPVEMDPDQPEYVGAISSRPEFNSGYYENLFTKRDLDDNGNIISCNVIFSIPEDKIYSLEEEEVTIEVDVEFSNGNQLTGVKKNIRENINLPEGTFKISAGKYNPWPDYDVTFTTTVDPGTYVLGEKLNLTVNWTVPTELTKPEYNRENRPVTTRTSAMNVELIKDGVQESVDCVGNKSFLITEDTSISLGIVPEGLDVINRTASSKTLGPKNYKFVSKTFYFWSKDKNLTKIPEGAKIYEFTDGGSYTPPDDKGWFFYIVDPNNPTTDKTYLSKLIGSNDIYYAEFSTKVGIINNIPIGTWSIPGKIQSVAITSRHALYRSVENVVHGQTVKLS